jgi:DNA-binding IclR family transcriptional regulator
VWGVAESGFAARAPSPRNNVVVRAVRLLQAAADRPEGSTALELAQAAGVPRASAARLVATLGDAGMLDRGRHGWVVGAELQRLARRADPHAALARRSRPYATRLAEATGESVTVSVPQGLTGIEVIAQVDAPNLLSTTNWIGRLFALHASSAGKVMLADLRWADLEARYRGLALQRVTTQTITDLDVLWRELERVRRLGYAESVDELEDGLVTLAAPVRAADGSLVAMLGVGGPSQRFGRPRRGEIVPVLVDEARRLQAALDAAEDR